MKVLVVGSLHFEGAEPQREKLIAACRDLGIALARAGCEIVVGSDSPNSADRYIVEAAMAQSDLQRVTQTMTILGLMGGWMIEPVADRLRAWFSERLP